MFMSSKLKGSQLAWSRRHALSPNLFYKSLMCFSLMRELMSSDDKGKSELLANLRAIEPTSHITERLLAMA